MGNSANFKSVVRRVELTSRRERIPTAQVPSILMRSLPEPCSSMAIRASRSRHLGRAGRRLQVALVNCSKYNRRWRARLRRWLPSWELSVP